MKIFSKQRIKSASQGYYPWKMPAFSWLAKTMGGGQEIFRNQMEGWYKNLPPGEKKDLLIRLTSLNDTEHLSAFYELLWHEFLLEEGWRLVRHPVLKSCLKRPEFLVRSEHQHFYFEVATVFDNRELRRSKKLFDDLLNSVASIKHYYRISISIEQWPNKPLRISDFKKKIEEHLEKALIGQIIFEKEIGIILDGFVVNIKILKDKSSEKVPVIFAVHYPGFSGSPGAPQMKKTLRNKIKKYKDIRNMETPLVIALCSEEEMFIDSRSLDYELFGYPVVTWTTGKNSQTTWSRARNGLVVPNKLDLSNPVNTRLSAVIFCKKMWSRENNRMEYVMEVYHNPWALNPLDEKVFDKLPQFVAYDDGNGGKYAEWKNRDPNKVIIFN